ncbi:C40 family peptidase [Martelella alba]|uniref:NlpC/P60 family protein n=1 Tax=Martelella alba TaxID=2590451 RepID=A0ABY2SJU0_9HYPH|nr:C40 family peptidase [Martelella alba]TKI05645.1 NlpC/P60 family protein [Martelella alba]
MRLLFTLFALLFTQLFFNLAHAAPNAGVNADQRKSQASTAKTGDRRKRKPVKITGKNKAEASEPKTAIHHPRHTASHTPPRHVAATVERPKTQRADKSARAEKNAKSETTRRKHPVKTSAVVAVGEKKHHSPLAARKIAKVTPPSKGYKKGYGRHRIKGKAKADLVADQPIKMSESHKRRYQRAKLTAMNKLLSQMGKPYRWGGMSPSTGFDCSGLIYYAYKDVVRIKMPRTANEMYHLRDAAPVKKNDLESGDLVFFHITNRGAADHVGVYIGNGRFIESPRTGRDIRISYLNEDYWQDHYVGARRVVTPQTVR